MMAAGGICQGLVGKGDKVSSLSLQMGCYARLWDKLQHLLGQNDMSILEAVIRVFSVSLVLPCCVPARPTSIRVYNPARLVRSCAVNKKTCLSDNSSSVFPPLGAILYYYLGSIGMFVRLLSRWYAGSKAISYCSR